MLIASRPETSEIRRAKNGDSGLSLKTFSNIRANFMTAVAASGLVVRRFARTPKFSMKKLFAKHSSGHIGLSRPRHASAKGIAPGNQ
jgi:hypothetical protein